MTNNDLDPRILIDMYGAELAQDFLLDLLENVDSDEERHRIEDAVDDLMMMVSSNQRFSFSKAEEPVDFSIPEIPPAFERDCVRIWLFDDAFISQNTIVGHFHGYRKKDGKTIRLKVEDVRKYREYIKHPRKLLQTD